ncbi:MAG: D-aminoacyl-tRNA deacylase, partial [Bacteroidetes bacterium]|nr:D-aminoacyl-tRNA deacylase [Bacteroidota bacterium]
MRLLIQRVKSASVSVDEKIVSSIEQGMLVLVGIEAEDNQEDIIWLSNKICG